MADHRDSSNVEPIVSDAPITPVEFSPLDQRGKRSRRNLSLWWPVTAVCLLAAIVVLWFLSTARSLVIEVEPAETVININGSFHIHLSDHFLIRPGNYQLTVTASGYQTHEQAIEVDHGDNQRLKIALDKLPGHLAITTRPPGALSSIDGNEYGATPLTVHNLETGVHELKLNHPRYLPKEQTIEIEGLDKTQTFEAILEPAWGDITIASEPGGATINLANKQLGTTPATIPAVKGQELSLSLPGRKTWTKTTDIEPGQQLDLGTITLAPADAALTISSQPTGASLTVNKQYRGVSPLTIELSPDHDHKLNIFLAGYENVVRTIKLASGEEQELKVLLKARLGAIEVSIQPKGSKLTIDGKVQKAESRSFQLPARPHTLKVEKNGYVSQQKTVTPKPGIKQSLRFTLLTPEQKQIASTPSTVQSPAGQTLKLFRPDAQFTMGAPRREQGRRANEIEHTVTLSKPFYLGIKEVTNREFKKYRANHSSSHFRRQTLDYDKQPVVKVSWNDAALYCNWLSGQQDLPPYYTESKGRITGLSENTNSRGYRLPTEAEWAWAARVSGGGSLLKFPWGGHFPPTGKTTNIADSSARHLLNAVIDGYTDGFAVSAPVGNFPSNYKGLFDLGGNVSEWIHDFYGISFGINSTATDPLGPESGQQHVIRGPSWRHGRIIELRLSYRDYDDKGRDDLGFRIARYLN